MSVLCTLQDILNALTNGLTIDNDCDAPLPVATCPDNPLEVTIVDDPADTVTVDVEYICNADTGLYDQVVTTTTNGVPAEPVTTATTTSCEDPPAPVVSVDVEYVCNEDTGVFDQVVTTTTDGVTAEPVIIPTAIVCVPPVVEVDVEFICNLDTEVWDQVTTTVTDGVQTDQTTVPTTIPCADVPDEVTVDVEYVCNEATGFWDEITTTTTNGVPADPVVEASTIECATPTIEVDLEYICNETTGFFDQVSVTTTDGVSAEPVITATTLPCEAIPPDFEVVRECRADTGTVWVVTYSIEADGTQAEISAIDTEETCPEPQTECVKWSSVIVQLDNTGTRYTETHEITFSNSDGSETVINVGPYAGWSQQITAWAAALDAAYTGSFDPRCTFLPNGCGGLLPPPSDAPAKPGIYARYVNGVFCPTDLAIPTEATITASDNPARVGQKLVLYTTQTPEKRGYRCLTCSDGVTGLFFDDGTPVPEADLPVCTFACAESIPEPPLQACDFSIVDGCDNTPDGLVPVVVVYTNCGAEVPTPSYYVDDGDGGLEDYNNGEGLVGGFVVDCTSGEVIPPPEPEPCETASIVACVTEGTEATCGWSLDLGAPNYPITIGEGGWTWTLCGEDTFWAEGTTISDQAALLGMLNAIDGVLASGDGQLLVFNLDCSCEAPQLVVGDDDPVVWTRDEPRDTEATEGENLCAELTSGCNDDRRDNLLSELVDSFCPCGGGESMSDPVVHQVQDNNTDFTWSYNGDTLKLQGQDPLNSSDAQPFYDAIIDCIEGGGEAKLLFRNPDGVQGEFVADSIISNNGQATGAFGGIGDLAQLQSGKVAYAEMVCCTEGEGEAKPHLPTVGCNDDEILSLLGQIEANTSPAERIQVVPVCDDVDGDPANYVPTWVRYTSVAGQPLVTEIFSDVGLQNPYTPVGTLVDCTTGEAIEDPDPVAIASNHLVEGCVLSDPGDPDSDKLSAFTIVNQDGVPLFPPKPLTDLGFVECC